MQTDQSSTPTPTLEAILNGSPVRTPEETASDIPTHVATHTLFVDAEVAQLLLDHFSWPRQRPIERNHVHYLRRIMTRGELIHLELTFTRLPNDTRYLVDGYHRLTALKGVNLTLPTLFKVYEVADEDAVTRMYMTFDRPKARGVATMLRATGIEETSPLNPTNINKIGSGAMMIEGRFEEWFRTERSLIKRVEWTQEWLPLGELYFRWILGANAEVHAMLTKQPTMAVALVSAKYQPERAQEFWRGAALEDRLERDDPRARLLAWMRANKRIGAYGAPKYAQYIAACWNAWMANRRMIYTRVPEGNFFMTGTPFKKIAEPSS